MINAAQPPVPVIPPVKGDGPRPFWSVMIPTIGTSVYLEETIASVLAQDAGHEEMQIEVIDNSVEGNVASQIATLAGDRALWYRQPRRVGMADNWNTCVERARGRWVHVLHDDDVVRPGFYATLRLAAEEAPTVGAAFCRHIHIDEDSHWQSIAPLEQRTAGVLPNWLPRISVSQPIQAAAIVVRRDVYEKLGGFRTDLVYAVDSEMWKRVAAHYAMWYDPAPLACYRMHASSQTSRLVRSGTTIADIRRAIELSRSYLPRESEASLTQRARTRCALDAVESARRLLARGDGRAAAAYLRETLRTSRAPAVLVAVTRFIGWAAARTAWRTLSR